MRAKRASARKTWRAFAAGAAVAVLAGGAAAQSGNRPAAGQRPSAPDGQTGRGAANYRVVGNATYGNGPFIGNGVYWYLGSASGWSYGYDGTYSRRSIAYPGWPLNGGWYGGWYGGWGPYGGWGYRYPHAYRSTPTQYWGPIDGRGTGLVTTSAEPVRELTARERADLAMASGAAATAAAGYLALLDETGEGALEAEGRPEVLRLFGLALLEADDRDDLLDGISVLRLAYEEHPELGSRRVPMSAWGGRVSRLREVLRDVVAEGHRAGGRAEAASAWVAAAVLMQAEGRDEVTLRMVDRAAQGGFGGEAEAVLRRAVSRRP